MADEQWDSFPLAPDPALASSRAGIAQELSSNPDLRRKLVASANAEVGNQNNAAQQAYVESVMNRASARNQSLDQTISSRAYYPATTTSKLNLTPSPTVQNNLNPMIDRALAGSNISGFATGNQSGKVVSGGAPVSFNPGTGDQFVIENPDMNWATGMGSPQATQRTIQQQLSRERGGFVSPDSSGGSYPVGWDNFPLVAGTA